MMKKINLDFFHWHSCFKGIALAGLLAAMPVWPAPAQSSSFADLLVNVTADGVLDRQDYKQIRQEAKKTAQMDPEDQQLSRHFLGFISKHKQFVKITYRFYRSSNDATRLDFFFAPNYTETEQVPGNTWPEVLSHISQNDTLAETQQDRFRCGASALLSAHFLLKQEFSTAFSLIGVPLKLPRPTYQEVHLAQEALYNYANSDGKPGLVSAVRYAIYSDGRVSNPVSEGEIQKGAELLKLNLEPLIGATRKSLHQRKDVVQRFWRKYPQGVLLVGVYLDDQSGDVFPPSRSQIQNHFMLVFRQKNDYFWVNSGVSDNGGGQALKKMSAADLQRFLYATTATLQGATLAAQ
jgi:hypothetical protein